MKFVSVSLISILIILFDYFGVEIICLEGLNNGIFKECKVMIIIVLNCY